MAPAGVLASWLFAVLSVPLTILTAAVGQGLGTLVVGGGWIGLCTPWDQQPWALVNEPTVNFAASLAATGYWCGSGIAPLLVAILGGPLSLRLVTLTGQLFMVQWGWASVVIGLAWLPALDPQVSHVTRWLQFRGLATELRWLLILAAVAAAVPLVLRLLSLARIASYHLGRWRRLAVVVVHLIPIPSLWIAVSIVVRGSVPIEACVAVCLPLAAAVMVPWFGYPMPLTHAIAPVRSMAFAYVAALIVAVGLVMWFAGRPLPGNRTAAIQWASSGATNNIRAWMQPLPAPWLDDARQN
jgi:hypothetical protein